MDFTLENFEGKTAEIRFSISPINEKIKWVHDENQLAGWLLKEPHPSLNWDGMKRYLWSSFFQRLGLDNPTEPLINMFLIQRMNW